MSSQHSSSLATASTHSVTRGIRTLTDTQLAPRDPARMKAAAATFPSSNNISRSSSSFTAVTECSC